MRAYKKYLTAALDQLSKLSGLVESILAMSMERRKNLTMTKEMIDLKELLTNIIEQQKLKADKPCEIFWNVRKMPLSKLTHTFLKCNRQPYRQQYQILGESVNIIIKADAKGVSIADNGIGIPEKSLPEIWNKFYRVPHGNRTDVRGYGIGLFYVKSIIDKHGWSIGVESKSGKGANSQLNSVINERQDFIGRRRLNIVDDCFRDLTA